PPLPLHAQEAPPLPLNAQQAAPLPLHAQEAPPLPLHAQEAPPLPLHAREAPPLPLHAQEAPPPADEAAAPSASDEDLLDEEEAGEEIVVTGQRLRGAVVGDIPPEVQLDARDIRAYGAGSLAELMTALEPQTRSGAGRGGGRPVILLNGRRISGFSEIRDLPPEAVERVDILPEEVALKYGYRADQRVVNFVLRPRFRAVTAEAAAGMATEGGRGSYEADLNVLRIMNNGRWNLDAEVRRDSALFESERDLIQAQATAGGGADGTDLGRFRTLLPQTDRLSLAGTVNRTILNDVSATLNARFDQTSSESRFGLPAAAFALPTSAGDGIRPLTRESDSRATHLGLSMNGDISPWRWSLTANYDRSNNRTLSDTNADPAEAQAGMLYGARERSSAISQSADAELVAHGSLITLPAGDISTSVKVGLDTRSLHSESNRGGTDQVRDLSRNRANGQVNIDVPLASRRNEVLSAIGNLSLNANAAVEHLSDFGTLRVLGGGINWSPIEGVRVLASLSDEDGAPTIQQLGDPVVLVPNVRVFDFTRGQTVDISRIEGGNPDLSADNRRVFKISANVKPWEER
ncbi:MAG TPA: TonB-dependent receptor, partial [Allosphingosinicella sp.]